MRSVALQDQGCLGHTSNPIRNYDDHSRRDGHRFLKHQRQRPAEKQTPSQIESDAHSPAVDREHAGFQSKHDPDHHTCLNPGQWRSPIQETDKYEPSLKLNSEYVTRDESNGHVDGKSCPQSPHPSYPQIHMPEVYFPPRDYCRQAHRFV